MSINRFIVMGYLGADPETRYSPDGDAIVEVRIATNNTFKDRNTGELKQSTEWHRLVAFGKRGELIASRCSKGDKAYFEAHHRTRKFVDQATKQDRYSDEFVITFADFMTKKDAAASHKADGQGSTGTGIFTGDGDDQDFPPI